MQSLFQFIKALGQSWTWKMAWRDSRRSRRRLLVFSSSIVLGIAALTALGSFARQMEAAIKEQAKSLLGADLVITSREPFNEAADTLLASLGGEQSREISFASMIYFPRTGSTRLVQIRALGGRFPFYGSFDTIPVSAAAELQSANGTFVEANLMAQFDAQVGDPVRIGQWTTTILGSLRRAPGETVAYSTIAPRVYMPLSEIEKTGLLRQGSLARYKVYFKFPPGTDVEQTVERLRPQLQEHRLTFDTVEERQQELGRTMENVHHYLNLIGFVALLLGGVGIASAIHSHIKQKLSTVAVLRCLGSSSAQAFAVYLVQAIALGGIGAGVGAALGAIIHLSSPFFLAEYLPVATTFSVSWSAIVQGVLLGYSICVLFALLPLLPVRRIPPLAALRSAFEDTGAQRRDPLRLLCYALIGAGILMFAISQSRRWIFGVWFAVGMWCAFGLLAGVAVALTWTFKGRVSQRWPFVWRQGLANLYRPNNRTVLMMVSLGLGTFIVLTMYLVQRNLIDELFPAERHQSGNAVLFDIQSDQKSALLDLLAQQNFPVIQQAAIVTMRLTSVRGRTVDEIRKNPARRGPNWAWTREYRSTYRSQLSETEKLIAGTWVGEVSDTDAPVPVSLEQGIAERLGVGLGDELMFDVQGISIRTRVSSLREVDWRRLHPNFFIVFPAGVLEEAPSFHVVLTHVASVQDSGRLHRSVVNQFPNISVVDLTLVLQTIDAVLSKISFVIRFMALFTVGTGLIVLVGAVLSGRYQRVQESILLRTLGATRKQVFQILAAEYFLLGVFASLTGAILAVGASWALAVFVFKVKFSLAIAPLIVSMAILSVLTVCVGLAVSRGISNHPPLEILRAEG